MCASACGVRGCHPSAAAGEWASERPDAAAAVATPSDVEWGENEDVVSAEGAGDDAVAPNGRRKKTSGALVVNSSCYNENVNACC